MSHLQHQKDQFNQIYSKGSRQHVISRDKDIKYIVSWRVMQCIKRLLIISKGSINFNSSILILCSGDGLEGSILSDMGYVNVTVSDISEQGVKAALERDLRLKGMVLNAEHLMLNNNAFDVVLLQDGLHHLSSPVIGFTEMLRVASKAVGFLEPHSSFVGCLIGNKWEKNGSAINYVFRWDKKLVEQVTSSFLGPEKFENHSFSFWHHNLVFAKVSKLLGINIGLLLIRSIKFILDIFLGFFGNQFCGLIIKK